MACATISLKRSIDFDPLSPRRAKRRRCGSAILTSLNTTPSVVISKPPSVFQEATPSLSKEQLADSIRTEIKRLRRRKTKTITHTVGSVSQSDSSDGELPSASPSTSTSQTNCSHEQRKDTTPLFTFKQMTVLCERMVKEQTERLCEEYDQVLASKLAEQYEAFLKFNHDQIHSHFANSSDASYLS
ncbi:akirin-2-like [Watersipora subatra]|uniref:akirin-2-like n=1 Tax=Watersipora subatra TaxID=2589382 RepID=UPI00355BE03E